MFSHWALQGSWVVLIGLSRFVLSRVSTWTMYTYMIQFKWWNVFIRYIHSKLTYSKFWARLLQLIRPKLQQHTHFSIFRSSLKLYNYGLDSNNCFYTGLWHCWSICLLGWTRLLLDTYGLFVRNCSNVHLGRFLLLLRKEVRHLAHD